MSDTKKKKLIYKVLLFILPLLVLSIAMTGIIISWTSYNHFLKTINTDYTNIIKRSAGEIGLYMEKAQKAAEGLALVMAATKLDRWQKQMALTAFNHSATEFMSVSLISTGGKEIVSTGWDEADTSHSQNATFKKALLGETAISSVMVTKENMPYVHIAVPVFRLGEVKEVLLGVLNLKYTWDVLEGIKVGDTGHVAIMDVSGRFIGHREIDRVLTTAPAQKPDIVKKLRESDEPVGWIEERDEVKFYCLGYHIPGLDWVIVLSQAYPEIYAYLYQNAYWAVFVTCSICLAAILLGWHRVNHFLTPIHTLHRQVQRIGRGDLDQKVTVKSQDEIGDLALAFNEMTDSLKTFIDREVQTAKELAHARNLAILGSASSKVTHEVGNLLNNVGLALSIAKKEALSPDGKRALNILEEDAGRVRRFIGSILQFAKKPDLRLQQVSMDTIIRQLLFIHQPDAEKRGISLDLEWPSDLPPVNVDTGLMYQVINNLIKNSLEAMTNSGKITIEGSTQGEHLLVILEDTGPGMAPDISEQIFDPFFTTKGQGTGLGLAIVKTIVEAHRGAIECRSELTKGTRFVLRLPRVIEPVP